MKNVLILGATGGIGHWVAEFLKEYPDFHQTVYVRNRQKLDSSIADIATVIDGDMTDVSGLEKAMVGQEIVVAALSGDWLGHAKAIVAAAKKTGVSRLVWVTGLGIHREVPGETGKILEYYVNRFPEYIEAADTIAASGIPYTLVRAANLMNGTNQTYYVQHEGEPVHAETVDRCAVAKYIVDHMITDADTSVNISVGITN